MTAALSFPQFHPENGAELFRVELTPEGDLLYSARVVLPVYAHLKHDAEQCAVHLARALNCRVDAVEALA